MLSFSVPHPILILQIPEIFPVEIQAFLQQIQLEEGLLCFCSFPLLKQPVVLQRPPLPAEHKLPAAKAPVPAGAQEWGEVRVLLARDWVTQLPLLGTLPVSSVEI